MRWLILGWLLLTGCAGVMPQVGDLTKSKVLRDDANTVGFLLDDVRQHLVAGCELAVSIDTSNRGLTGCAELKRLYNTAVVAQKVAEDLIDNYETTGYGYDQAKLLIDEAHKALQAVQVFP